MAFNNKKQRNRRDFLKNLSTLSLLGSGAAAFNGKMHLVGSALAQGSGYADLDDYKSLVCVFLYGGADSFNMFVPTDPDKYSSYQASRGSLAVDSASLLAAHGSSSLAFNEQLPRLNSMYAENKLALISNVGNLIAPLSRAQVLAGSSLLPSDLFAHNHQQEQWLKGRSSTPASLVGSGWGGRMADLLQEANAGSVIPPTMSISGTNYWLPGQITSPLSIHQSRGLNLMEYLDSGVSSNNVLREQTFEQMLSQSQSHPLKNQVQLQLAHARSGSQNLQTTLNTDLSIATEYDTGSSLASQLRMVARLIAGRENLNMRRQIFFVSAGGWDTHDHQGARLDLLLQDLDQSMGSFHDTLVELELLDTVTSFTASDFGRTLTINGDGSDHGWGGHYMVMGGAVNGGSVYGSLPSYQIGDGEDSDDSGDKGRIIPQLSVNQFGASMGQWMGLGNGDLETIFPDLAHFGTWDSDLAGLFASA